MEKIKRYTSIRNMYISEEVEFKSKLRKGILLLNPIIIGLFSIVLILLYFIDYEILEYIHKPILSTLIISFLLSVTGTIIKRVKLMEKQKYRRVTFTNYNLIKILLVYMCLGDIFYILIKQRTDIMLGWIFSSNGEYYFGFIFLVIIIFILGVFTQMREFFFERSLKLVTNDIKSGNIELAKESLNKNIKGKHFWGDEYLVVFYQLKDLIKKLEDRIERAKDREMERRELITNASHDIKTPLTSIISYSKILQDTSLNEEEINEYKEILKSKSNRLSNLIKELKDASESEDEEMKLKIESYDIEKIINNVIKNNKDKIDEKYLSIIVNKINDNSICEIDVIKTERVIQNLISNIYKYSKYNSDIVIDIEGNDEVCKITLINKSEKDIVDTAENLLKRFTRGDRSRNTEGYGLGLNIAKRLIEAQGGSINLGIIKNTFKVILYFKR